MFRSIKLKTVSKLLFGDIKRIITVRRNVVTTSNKKNENWTYDLEILKPETIPQIKAYRVMDESGKLIDPKNEPKIDEKKLVDMYKAMIKLNTLDKIMYESQRQGRISFYMTNYGEEATHLGSGAALDDKDLIYAQYREAGLLLWRGFTIKNFMNQLYSNQYDIGKGKQMPVHYGCKKLNFVSISSPLTTQMPQAVGSAYAFKRAKNGQCVIVYFGDGAASEGDAHAALNFSATLECPIIFFCRNNGYAISTPVHEQYRGDGIAGRASGYGMACLRIDGNDILAVYNATAAAREYALTNSKPILLEAMTYRVGHHSTSDDSSAYRTVEEVNQWIKTDNPIVRAYKYLVNKNLWDENEQVKFEKEVKTEILKEFAEAEKVKKPKFKEMFSDVYFKMEKHLEKQQEEMELHLKNYSQHYPIDSHAT